MYPERELTRLADRKAFLSVRIGLHRFQCREAAARAFRPLSWMDRAGELLKRIQPLALLAAVPMGLLAGRSSNRAFRVLGSIARWVPIVLGGAGRA